MTRSYHSARNEQWESPEKYVLSEGPMFYDKKQFVDSQELREMANLFMDLSIKCPTLSTG